MERVQALYLEDNTVDQKRYSSWIKTSWQRVRPGIALDIEPIDSPETAAEMLQQRQFSLFIVDIMFGKKPKDRQDLGLGAIRDARSKYPDLGIIAISIGNGSLAQLARDRGADEFISKDYLAKSAKETYAGETLLNVLARRGKEPTLADPEILKLNEPDDIRLIALVNTIGKTNIINLTVEAVAGTGHCRKIVCFFIRSGLSGASVVKVDCDIEEKAETPYIFKPAILKISRDQESLRVEGKKNLDAFPEEKFVRYSVTEPVKSAGWYALAAPFKHNAITFYDWLIKKKPEETGIQEFLNALFLQAPSLSETYERGIRKDTIRPNVALWKVLSESRRARISEAIDDFRDLVRRYDNFHYFDEKILNAFLNSRRIGTLDEEEFPVGTTECIVHGDFHARNILWTTHGPRIIDAANIGAMHWAVDVARLAVDLIVSGLNADHESYEWTHLQDWCQIALKFVRADLSSVDQGQVGSSNFAILAAMKWIRQNLKSIFKIHFSEWQFRLAVAIEFLRASYRIQELAGPKRVLGILAGCEALRETQVAFQEEIVSARQSRDSKGVIS